MNDTIDMMNKLGIDDGGRDLLDLTDPKFDKSTFDLNGYVLTSVFDDIVLLDMIDVDETGLVKKGELYINSSRSVKTWRKGKVVLVGCKVTQCKPNDIVILPNDMGIQVSNINVDNYGNVYRGIFVKEDKIFGVCKKE